MSFPISLSIIIVGWNSKEVLEVCLESLYEYPPSCKFEVIYVDNGSEDRTLELVQKRYSEVIIIENDENLGFQKANNQGLRVARGKYIILLNSDTIILPGTFDNIVAFMDAHPLAGAASPKCLYPDGRVQWSISHFPSVRTLWWWLCSRHYGFRWLLKLRKLKRKEVNKIKEQEYAYGAFFTLRREILDTVGYMDESLFFSGDDAGWSRRIKAKGWKIFYVPDVEVIHYGSKTEKKRSRALTVDWIVAHRILLYRYRSIFSGLVGDLILLTDSTLNFIENIMRPLFGRLNKDDFERPLDELKILKEAFFRKICTEREKI